MTISIGQNGKYQVPQFPEDRPRSVYRCKREDSLVCLGSSMFLAKEKFLERKMEIEAGLLGEVAG